MRLDRFSYCLAVCTFTSACTTVPVDIGDKDSTGEGGKTFGSLSSGGKSNPSGGGGAGSGGMAPVTDGGKAIPPQGGSGGTPPNAGGGGKAIPPQGGSGGTPPNAGGGGKAIPPQGGSGGTPIDVSTAGKNQGGSGGLEVCNFPTGPKNTWGPQRRTLTWTFRAAPAGEGGAGGAGGADGLDSSCSIDEHGIKNDHCQGTALLRENSGLPEVVFGDGNKLLWDPSGAADWVSPPIIRTGGELVWVDYVDRLDVVCAFCGSYTTRKLMIRDGVDGPVRFMAREGHRLDDLSDAEAQDVFGVPATRSERCSTSWTDNCRAITRVEFEHTLLGQVVPPATFTVVAVPKGEFAVFWTASQETLQQIPNCLASQDGPGIAQDTGFAASRITP